ncbi:MAG: hypothetical protein ACU83V_15050, partial [Gammaproteobacteria bacterium]
MNKMSWISVLLTLFLWANSVYADIELKSPNEVEGTWKLQYTKNSATAKQTIQREDTWVFKGGKL